VIDRRTLIVAAAASLLAARWPARAQAPGRVHRIGFLSPTLMPPSPSVLDALRDGLRQHGYVEGRNLVLEFRFAEFKLDRLPALASELVHQKADLLLTSAGPATHAAMQATRTLPIVMIAVGNPVEQGLVASLARPGGNVTGLAFGVGADAFAKSLELLQQALPAIRRVAVLRNPAPRGAQLLAAPVQAAAAALGLETKFFEAREPGHFDEAFAAIGRERVDALLALSDPMFNINRVRLAELAAAHRVPAMWGSKEHVVAGGLMAYGPDVFDLFRRAATFVDRIFKGARPADLPVEQPTKFELAVNVRVARTLGVTLSPAILARADEVVQ
jgi:putative ABC transport system substrate-binding protein